MITDPAVYFRDGCGRCARFASDQCSARVWGDALARLRALCLDAGMTEELRWGHPCYRHAGRNLALIGAFKDGPRLTLPDAALLDDPEGLLEAGGPASAGKSVIRFADLAEVEQRAGALTALLRQARELADLGKKPTQRPAKPAEIPSELSAALSADEGLATAFASLTPGRQRSYVIALSSAKTSATRVARVAKFREKILAGKGATER